MKVLTELERYIDQTLGLPIRIDQWDGEKGLPFFLRDAYSFFVLRLQDRAYLLMVDVQNEETPPSTIRKQLEQLRKAWADEVIYVRERVTAYNRNRLIQHKVPFVVPGNQMYLPMLAIDLREHFVRKRAVVKKLSPAAQVLVLHSIYQHRSLFGEAVTMTDWAAELGYTKMTMSRAFREIRSVLAEEECSGEIHGRELWERMLPYLRSPVTRRRYYDADFDFAPEGSYICGDGALAHYTMMAEPNHMTVCMSVTKWKKFQVKLSPVELSRLEPACLELEIWKYVPKRLAKGGVADPLSVYLSYEKNSDERVEMALDQLLEKISW